MPHSSPATLIGCAVADALGMPFETRTVDDPFLRSWDGLTYLHSDHHQLGPGQWTDDTMMSRLLAEALVLGNSRHDFDAELVATKYAHWFENGPHRGMGKTTGLALSNLSQGEHWGRSGIKGAEGNGTAMRAAPIGVFYRLDLDRATDTAKTDAYITHASKEASEGSVMIALAAAYVARQWPKPGLVSWLCRRTVDCQVGRNIHELEGYIRSGMSVQTVLQKFGTKAHVVQTVPSAIAAFAMTESYLEAVQVAIRAGGDTDTTAAVTGAIAGTYYGLDSIPQHLIDGLEDRDPLLELDRRLFFGR